MSSDLVHTPRAQSLSASLAERIKQHQRATGTFLLLDCSYSMSDEIAPHQRAIDKLRTVARQLREDSPAVRQVAFPVEGHAAIEIAADIPEPGGNGTPLAEAIDYAAGRGALHLIVVSDGAPNDEQAALRAATASRCRIDVCFIGRAGDPGEAFLRRLAAASGGQCDTLSLATKALETKIRGFLNA